MNPGPQKYERLSTYPLCGTCPVFRAPGNLSKAGASPGQGVEREKVFIQVGDVCGIVLFLELQSLSKF